MSSAHSILYGLEKILKEEEKRSGIVPKNWDVECEVLVVGGEYLGLGQFRGPRSAIYPPFSDHRKSFDMIFIY